MNLRRVNYPVFILVGIVASVISVISAPNTTNPLLSSAFALEKYNRINNQT